MKGTRKVPVELIVNGEAVEKKLIEADGQTNDVEFDFTPERSSWVAVRVFPAAHTNPIFVEVDGKPIRASKRSAQWCLDAVDAAGNRSRRRFARPRRRPPARPTIRRRRFTNRFWRVVRRREEVTRSSRSRYASASAGQRFQSLASSAHARSALAES